MSSNTKSEKMKLAPIRSLNDFLLDSKKYLPPTFSDLKRFNNRTTSNLLYYQTNYFVISASVLSVFLIFCFNRMLTGAFGIAITVAAALFATDRLPIKDVATLRAKYPMATYGAFALDILVVYQTFRLILFLLLVLLVPVVAWFAHASMRSRGLKNKVSNKMEQMGAQVYASTPMGFVLQSLGIEAKDLED